MKQQVKQQATVLRKILKERNVVVSHSVALDCVSRLLGEREWNALAAKLNPQPEYAIRITGTFKLEEDDQTRVIDVTAWFAQADEETILDLNSEEYEDREVTTDIFDFLIDEEQADAVAANAAHCQVNDMFPGADIGFDFVINAIEARAWLEKYRPDVAKNFYYF